MASKSKMLSSLVSDEVRGDQGGKPVSSTALVTIEYSPDTLFSVAVWMSQKDHCQN